MSDEKAGRPVEAEPVVDVVVGDRVCDACGFNLYGQKIFRERHYRMHIARCPECGAVAAMHESPRSTRWIGFATGVVMSIWLILLLGGLGATAMMLFGFNMGGLEQASRLVSRDMDLSFETWRQSFDDVDSMDWQRQRTLLAEWLADADVEEALDNIGGYQSLALTHLLPFWLLQAAILFGAGVVWSTLLLHARRRLLPLFGVFIAGLAGVFLTMHFLSLGPTAMVNISSYTLAKAHVADRVMIHTLLVGAGALLLGMWFGRPIARSLVKILLPPRLRAPLSRLWLCDGKDFPVPKRRPIAATPAPAAHEKDPAPKSAGSEDS